MLKILIVDDYDDVTFTVKKMLERIDKNYSVAQSHSADEALIELQKDEFDLVIVDIMMPGKDGFIFMELLKEDEETKNKHIPIVILTAKTDLHTKKTASYLCDAYLTKPVEPMVLDVTIKKALKDTGSIKYAKLVLDE